MRVGIVRFPGSTGADDAVFAFSSILGCETVLISHKQEHIREVDLVVVPGGFAFGDALRPGALARLTAVAAPLRRYSRSGKLLGIGNGFQILCELGILGGALLPNPRLRLYQDRVSVRIQPGKSFLKIEPNTVLSFPMSCYAGQYFANGRVRRDNEEQQLIVGKYCSADGTVDDELTVNNSVDNVAVLTNSEGNALGLMGHPERAVEEICGSTDGKRFLQAVVDGCSSKV